MDESETELTGAPKRPDAKRHAIVTAATSEFLQNGYEAASMDAIAAKAEVSKRTVYNHFPSKRELFRAVTAALYSGLTEAENELAPRSEPPEIALPRLAQAILKHLRKPEVTGLIRLVIAEQERIPEVAAEFQAVGKGPAIALVEKYIAAQTELGTLDVKDPLLAAQQYLGSIKESVFWPKLIGLPVNKDDDEVIAAATQMLLTTYKSRRR